MDDCCWNTPQRITLGFVIPSSSTNTEIAKKILDQKSGTNSITFCAVNQKAPETLIVLWTLLLNVGLIII